VPTTSIQRPSWSLTPAQFVFSDNSTPGIDGLPGGANPNGSDVSAEDDDVISVTLTWLPTTDWPYSYRIYRKALDEAHFVFLGSMNATDCGANCVYHDKTVTKADYTYYVTAYKLLASEWEESEGTPASPAQDHAVSPFVPTNVKVRNVTLNDGRDFFYTANNVSRLTTVKWSRAVHPGVTGYNIYRMCSFWGACLDRIGYIGPHESLNTFACEPDWVRLNQAPLSLDHREFVDDTTGGLQGCFMYAVRPVAADGVEGSISKVTVANLWNSQIEDWVDGSIHTNAALSIPSDDLTRDATCAAKHCRDAPTVQCGGTSDPINCPPNGSTDPECPQGSCCVNGPGGSNCTPTHGNGFVPMDDPIDTALNHAGTGINQIARGTGSPTLPVRKVSSATALVHEKETSYPGFSLTQFAQVSWSWNADNNPQPSNLMGYYIVSPRLSPSCS
jgi:hypothetical protein